MTLEEVERIVLRICSEVLEVDEATCAKDLYGCGATSFSVIFIVGRLQQELNVQLSQGAIARIFLGKPTIESVASEVYSQIDRQIKG